MKLSVSNILSIFFVGLSSICLLSQNENSKWYFGNNAGVDFMTSPPTALTGSMAAFEGCASIADANGNLLFYTNGITVYNANHAVMANGNGLFSDISNTQSALIVKKPGSSNIYYVFTSGSFFNPGLYYTEIDMVLAAGMGSVTSLNNPVSPMSSEKITGSKHINGIDYWVLSYDNAGNFVSTLVTAGGVNTSLVLSPATNNVHEIGCLKFSPDGRRVACANYNTKNIELYDFNNASGALSNPLLLSSGLSFYGCEFSPDGTKLYSSFSHSVTTGINQWDLCAGSNLSVVNSCITIADSIIPGTLSLAPNGKIYHSTPAKPSLGVINYPNNSGLASNFILNSINISPNLTFRGLPNLITTTLSVKPPLYPFTHTVSNNFGCQTASFTPHNLSIRSCNSYSFSVDSLRWNFGDPLSGSANTSNLTNPLHSFTKLQTYTVQLVLYYCCGTPNDTLSSTVNINQNCISLNSFSITCASLGSATVSINGGVGPYTYTWLPSSQNSSVATGLYPGTYSVTVFDAGTNITSSITTVFSSTVPLTGSLSVSNSVVCNGVNNGQVSINNIVGGTGDNVFLWSNGINTFTSTSNVINNLSAGNWTITVSDKITKCAFTDKFTIVAANAPSLSVLPLNSIACDGLPAKIFANSNSSNITWQPALGLNTTIGTSVLATPLASQIYTATAQNNGCSITGTAMVNVISPPSITITPSKNAYCSSEAINLIASGANTYSWTNPQGNIITGANATFNANQPGFNGAFTVIGSDKNGCIANASIKINIKNAPNVFLRSSVFQACVPFYAQISLDKIASDSAVKPISWTVENKTIFAAQLDYYFDKPGIHKIAHNIIDTITSCIYTHSIQIVAKKKPIADFNFLPENPTELQDEVKFELISNTSELKDWSWTIPVPHLTAVPKSTPTFYRVFEKAGVYPVVLQVQDLNGCTDTLIKILIIQEDISVFVPNSFSPNYDKLNDVFVPVTRGVDDYIFQIFDRWGHKIFETNILNEGWDGTHKGVNCKQDVYVWKLTYSTTQHQNISKTKMGEVLLIR